MIYLRNWYRYDVSTIKEQVPPTSGVYLLFSHQDCICVGSSRNLQEDLTSRLTGEADPCVAHHPPDEFRFEVILGSERDVRRKELIAELNPVCRH